MTNLLTMLLFWNINTELDISSYHVYPKIVADNALVSYEVPHGGYIDVGNTNVLRVSIVSKHIHYFVVTAVNVYGIESEPSNMIYVIKERQ